MRAPASAGWIVLALASTALAGCEKKPGGQVVAVVNGEEITQQELRAEAEGAQVPANQDIRKFGPQVLPRVIDRALLADYARQQGLDRGPEYVARRRQLEQTLLASLAIRKIVGTPAKPSAAEVQRFIDAQPTTFSQRQRLTLDQVRFPTPASNEVVKGLTKLGSVDAIEAQLKSQGVAAQRGPVVLDTATVAPDIARQIIALKPGAVFDFSANGTTFMSTVVARAPAVADPKTWTAPATEALSRQKTDQLLKQAVDKMRASAKIEIDPAIKASATPQPGS